MSIVIVGLGPGDAGLITRQAWELLSAAENVYLRTGRHPAAAGLPAHLNQVTFDDIYDSAANFEELYQAIAAAVLRLGREAHQAGRDLVYAVPGNPNVGEATVTAIRAGAAAAGVPVTVVPGLSFIDVSLSPIDVDALAGLQLFDALDIAGYNHPPVNPDMPALLGQVYSQLVASDLKLALMALYPDDHEVALIHGAGTAEAAVESLPLYGIDRSPHLGHLTTLFVPPLPNPTSLSALAETVAFLRGPDGCPWDREQTPQSLTEDLLEEVAELLDAIEAGDPAAVAEELGDVLFHLVIQAQIAAEAGDFALGDVIAGIDAKLKRRHPHIWGDWQAADSQEVIRNWEHLKLAERRVDEARPALLDGIPRALPALARAERIQQEVAKVGFDWPAVDGVEAKVEEELAEFRAAATGDEQLHELGDLFFALVNWARWLKVEPERALREANRRFARRFRRVEELAAARGMDLNQLGLAQLDELWDEAKRNLYIKSNRNVDGDPREGKDS
jgi:tetrapyrrole methylase family protein/MazG family protein